IAVLKAVISLDLKNFKDSTAKVIEGTAEVVQDAMKDVTDSMKGPFGK
ncbi:MAG: hypothetical protein IH802_06680, partial [Nitrospinae bacterium]|nr:hypothetical protein [Nitrospinota bacterium]